uniref:Uncharacterized protein n=1 Tax=Arundo donax TaxID=35708 RepID=A0A0A9BHA2_ARUDO
MKMFDSSVEVASPQEHHSCHCYFCPSMARFLNSQGSGSVGVSFPANPVICVTLV